MLKKRLEEVFCLIIPIPKVLADAERALMFDRFMETEKKNYFSLFGIKTSFDVDLKVVDREYLELQRKYHPDSGYDCDKYSSYINSAYNTIKSDIKRAEYLLKDIFGFQFHTVSDIGFFEQVEQLRERLIKNDEELIADLNAKQRSEVVSIRECFDKNDLNGVARSIMRYKFFQSLKKQKS